MRYIKRFLVPILFLFSIGAVAQTPATNGGAVVDQRGQAATFAAADDAQLSESARFMSRSQHEGLLDHVFIKTVNANLFPALAVPTALQGCTIIPNSCSSGQICCQCFSPARCVPIRACECQ
jgi:hypothetical protein